MCHELPTLDGLSAALGCWYVLEGASLGGQIISRQVRASLGMTGETGARFFQGYAERTGEMWKRFRAVLTAWVVTPEEQERSIRAALGTFRTLRRWCRQEPADDR